MHIVVNGIQVTCKEENLVHFLRTQGVTPVTLGIAVALNETVVPACCWHEHTLKEGDILEIVKPFQGG